MIEPNWNLNSLNKEVEVEINSHTSRVGLLRGHMVRSFSQMGLFIAIFVSEKFKQLTAFFVMLGNLIGKGNVQLEEQESDHKIADIFLGKVSPELVLEKPIEKEIREAEAAYQKAEQALVHVLRTKGTGTLAIGIEYINRIQEEMSKETFAENNQEFLNTIECFQKNLKKISEIFIVSLDRDAVFLSVANFQEKINETFNIIQTFHRKVQEIYPLINALATSSPEYTLLAKNIHKISLGNVQLIAGQQKIYKFLTSSDYSVKEHYQVWIKAKKEFEDLQHKQ